MNIKTKFNIGDTLWTVRCCKAYSFTANAIVCDMSIPDTSGNTHLETCYAEGRYGEFVPESHCFLSREDLLKYVASGNV